MSVEAPLPPQLSGDRFATGLQSGIHRVILEQEALNAINVFPVADGDTGTNLSLTLGAALGVLQQHGNARLHTLLAATADVLLDSARGNSGAIVAQFFQGLSDAAGTLAGFTAPGLATAVTLGSEYARDALSEPREGTILSVIAAFAGSLQQQTANGATPGFTALLDNALVACREALVRTQVQLEALRKAGVVDAGARGFVALLEGFSDCVVRGKATARPEMRQLTGQFAAAFETSSPERSAFRYCTECVVSSSHIDRRKLREALSELGDSLVLAGTRQKARIHVHVNAPDRVFALARRHGRLSGEKADDMHAQQRSAAGARARFAVIADSAADIDEGDLERLDIHMVPLRIQFGERGYLDKVSISADEFFDELRNNPHQPTTSQPSPGDFRRQFQFLATHYPDVISINLTDKVSGTLQAARSAAERTHAEGRVHVVNSLNASLGQGLIAVFAAECAAAGLDAARALAAIDAAIAQTYSFGLVSDLRYAVRGGRVPASRKLLADLLRITPVLRSEADGRLSASGMLPRRRRRLPGFCRYIAKRLDPGHRWRIAIGHAQCPDDADELQALLAAQVDGVEASRITDLGSALGAHGGPGTIVVGVQRYREPAEFA